MKLNTHAEIISEAKIVFFDLDETLTDRDTDSLWASWRSRREIRGWGERFRLAGLYWKYKRGIMTVSEYMRYHAYRLSNIPADKIRLMSAQFFIDTGIRHIYPAAEKLVHEYINNGTITVMLTAQNECVARPFAEHLGIKNLISNKFYETDNYFTGPVEPYCFSEGKIIYASRFAELAGIPLKHCAFYSDSIYDAPLLGKTGFPVAVNPDRLLRAEAEKNNWRIVKFDMSSADGHAVP